MISAIDSQTFNSVRHALGDEAFEKFVNSFHKETAQLLQQLRKAASQNDTQRVSIISSKIKAASQQLGAARLMYLACQLNAMTTVQTVIQSMQQEYYSIVSWLNEHYLGGECTA